MFHVWVLKGFVLYVFIYIYNKFGFRVILLAQVSSANLVRSYRRAPKGAGEEDCQQEGAGVCHLCMCGTGPDWEDMLLNIDSSIFPPVLCLYI